MKKLKCRSYLNHAVTQEQLYKYTGHLFSAHRRILANSTLPDSRFAEAHKEVDFLAGQVEGNYAKSCTKRG